MQHQTLTLAPCVTYMGARYLAARYLTRDGWRSVSHFAPAVMAWPHANSERREVSAREQAIAMFESAIDEDGRAFQAMNVLSVDAWSDGAGGWTWNNWHKRGTLTVREFSKLGNTTRQQTRATLAWFREHGYLSDASKGTVTLEDDGYNLVVCDRRTREPLIAIEYGTAYP